MNVFVILLAVLMNGKIAAMEYAGGTDQVVEFKTKAACEKTNAAIQKELPKVLPKDVVFIGQVCIPREAKGSV